MQTRHGLSLAFRPTISFVLLLAFLAVLWVAGGASRADTLGQVIVRAAAWAILLIFLLVGDRPTLSDRRPLLLLLIAAIALPAIQLVPLPPALWQSLPGRAIFIYAAKLSGQPQPWRPWSIVPELTLNAVFSLIVPMLIFLLVTSIRDVERKLLPGILLALIGASTFAGLLQFSGGGFGNPFVNDTPGQVSAIFANRNHFALLEACGCALAPIWAFLDGRRASWRGPVAIGLVLVFALTILASGSRAGMLVGVVGLGAGLLITWPLIRRELLRYPRWVFQGVIAGTVISIVLIILVSVAAGRAISISRAFSADPGQDMRSLGLGTVLTMIKTYFPMGSGLGSFDPIFRIHEPFELLKLSYFNHAHNDFLEIVIDGGLIGLVLLIAGVAWWARASIQVWQAGTSPRFSLPKLGSVILLLVMIASAFDYPARTPIIMAVIVIAATWLCEQKNPGQADPALPMKGQPI